MRTAGDTEVDQLRPLWREDDVLRLQIPMGDAVPVDRCRPLGERGEQPQGAVGRERPARGYGFARCGARVLTRWPASTGTRPGDASINWAVQGLRTASMAAASRRNRVGDSGWSLISSRIAFTATGRPPGDRPRRTCPMPPAPSRARICRTPVRAGSWGRSSSTRRTLPQPGSRPGVRYVVTPSARGGSANSALPFASSLSIRTLEPGSGASGPGKLPLCESDHLIPDSRRELCPVGALHRHLRGVPGPGRRRGRWVRRWLWPRHSHG